jgi:spore germination protein
MKRFEYNDKNIDGTQFLIAITATGIGIVILVFQRELADLTIAADGLILILAGGIIASLFIWFISKFASKYRQQTFFSFASTVASKPVAVIICFIYALLYLLVSAYEVRKLTDITQHYLLEETPIEVLSLSFLLVVVYAVAGSRVGLFRLNTMFMPFVLFVSIIILIFNVQLIDTNNFMPLFKTSAGDHAQGLIMMIAIFTAGSAGVVLFYASLVESKTKLPKLAVYGTLLPAILFFLFYFVAIGVFGNKVTGNLLYASIELGKSVDVPGGVFERFESIFFIIWVMTVFNLTTMVVDLSAVALQSIFKNTKKVHILFIMTPIIYFVSMLPRNMEESAIFGEVLVYCLLCYPVVITLLLFIVSKIRGVKGS